MNVHTGFHRLGAVLFGSALLALATSSCSGPANGRTEFNGPSVDTFKPVADMLGKRCGTLDCHGNINRNMRIYSYRGLRLDPSDMSGGNLMTGKGLVTSDAEYQATYTSVLTLEPELMGKILFQHGDPTQLTMIKKARGLEHHKGRKLWNAGDPADRCLISWLTGHVDTNACKQGEAVPGAPKQFQGM